jgi:CRISPR-associated protein Csx10
MHELKFEIFNESPLVFSSKFGDLNMVYTKDYIPGNTVLGIIANQFARKKQLSDDMHTDAQFCQFFLSGQVIFGHAYISCDKTLYPLPFSIQKDKYGDMYHELLFHSDVSDTRYTPQFCHIQGEKIELKTVKKRIHFHHARNRTQGVPEVGLFFNYESISPGQSFRGAIKGSSSDLHELINICGTAWNGFAGRSKNAQYGRIQFKFIDTSPQKIVDIQLPKKQLSLTLLSDTIIYNSYGFPSTNRADIKNYLPGIAFNQSDTSEEDCKSFVKHDKIEGYSAQWRLKTPSAPCFKAGSTFLVDISNCDPGRLNDVQQGGLGERTHEGYGQCQFGWQTDGTFQEMIHLDSKASQPDKKDTRKKHDMKASEKIYNLLQQLVHPSIAVKEASEKVYSLLQELINPSIAVSDTVKKMLHELCQKYMIQQVQLKALEDQQAFVDAASSWDPLPSNSLIAKLGAMAESSNSETFCQRIQDLRETAINQLKNCHNEKETLYEFLLKQPVEDCKQKPAEKQSARDDQRVLAKKQIKDIEGFPDYESLHKTYWQTFFSMMRKHTKELNV